MAKNQICSKRLLVDENVAAIDGVHFFPSSITEIEETVNCDEE